MKVPMCDRCHRNPAVVFITKIDQNSNSTQEGLCLKCAKEIGVKPIDQLMEQMGITDDTLDMLAEEIGSLKDLDGLVLAGTDGEDQDAPHRMIIGGDDEGEEEGDDEAEFNPFARFRAFREASEKRRAKASAKDARSKSAKKKRKYLTSYCVDLTERAAEGRLDRVVGRERETDRIIQILNRRQKNNPCLIGEPGVGKTAVAEGLALRIVKGEVPAKLADREVYLLDLTALVAGTQFRGQFESRMKGLIEEIKECGNIILVIDEVHNIVGAGDSEGSMNAANILKPALSRGEIQVIGATTFKEYRKYIERDAALERRFQPVTLGEPSVRETAEILKGVRGYYETFHGVSVSDEMCELAAELSERYITDRYLPDKAIDLIDEACSRLNLESPQISEAATLQKRLEEYTAEREALGDGDGDEQNYARMAELKSLMLQTEERLHEVQAAPVPEIDAEHLAGVIELWTGIPASKVQAQELERLRGMEERLRARVVGQDAAIDAICASIRRSRAGISPKRKPVSFLFAGPTGVGKTELVKTLAADLFDTPEALIRLDMSEYMEKHTASRLLGSPPGYVGYDEAGQLTEKIRRRPYSVILLDEIEKAHPDVLNTLLQILDDGRISDSHGREVNFENTVIVMTSNAGSDLSSAPVGFGKNVTEQAQEKATRALEKLMRPEFLNRIDEIVAFNQLTKEDFRQIAGILLGDLRDGLAKRGMRLTWDDALLDYLVEKGYSLKFGARNLRRLVEKEIENALAIEVIAAGENRLAGAHLSAEDGALKVQTV